MADERIGSQKNFVSLFAQASIYRPAKETVVAASLRFGWSQPYGKTDRLPITERYFAGGSTTLRAFGRDQAGTKRGGNALAILNVEYRFPIRFPISGLGGAVFYDTGTTFSHISDFYLGAFTHTAGFGLRYDTPLGPIVLDFGFNLNRQINEMEAGRERTSQQGVPDVGAYVLNLLEHRWPSSLLRGVLLAGIVLGVVFSGEVSRADSDRPDDGRRRRTRCPPKVILGVMSKWPDCSVILW